MLPLLCHRQAAAHISQFISFGAHMVGVQTEELGAKFDKPNVPSTPLPSKPAKTFLVWFCNKLFPRSSAEIISPSAKRHPQAYRRGIGRHFFGGLFALGHWPWYQSERGNVCGGAVRWSEERLLSAFASMDEENGEYLMAMGFQCNSIGLHARWPLSTDNFSPIKTYFRRLIAVLLFHRVRFDSNVMWVCRLVMR